MELTMEEKNDLFDSLQNAIPFMSNIKMQPDEYNRNLLAEINTRTDTNEIKLLRLLYKINSIRISENVFNPFEPYIVLENKKITCIPDFLSNEELDFFIKIFDLIKNEMLKARVSDILWFLKYKKDVKYPNYLITVYQKLDICSLDTFFENILLYKRATLIAKQMHKDLSIFENNLYNIFTSKGYDNNSQLIIFAETLRVFDFSKSNSSIIINKLIDYGKQLENDSNYTLAEQYYNEASLWAETEEDRIRIQIYRVRAFINFAEAKNTSGLAANKFYTKAIEILRELKKETREQFFTTDEEQELIRKKQNSGKEAISEMQTNFIPMDNLNNLIIQIQNEVLNNICNKSKEDALFNFACLTTIKEETFENQAKQMNNSAFFAISNMDFYAKDGRKIGSTYSTDEDNSHASNPQIFNMMVYHYTHFLNLITFARIITGLDYLNLEHHISYNDVKTIVHQSYLIPEDREEVVCKGLLAGFSHDFTISLNLLAPQFENIVRNILQRNGVKTITLGEDGKEIEIGLSNLVKIDEFKKLFGEDLTFEIRALLCESIGPNLRNNTAHGLLNDCEMNSNFSIYFWWFFFSFIYRTFYSNKQNS